MTPEEALKYTDVGWAVLDSACMPEFDRKTLVSLAITIGKSIREAVDAEKKRCLRVCDEQAHDLDRSDNWRNAAWECHQRILANERELMTRKRATPPVTPEAKA